jgi:hypothetical protein
VKLVEAILEILTVFETRIPWRCKDFSAIGERGAGERDAHGGGTAGDGRRRGQKAGRRAQTH